ncbi:transposase [Cognaticolwellia beringensis]|uniref:Transposase n=1 Tax=Cognaticolwellia beringensis TaxID=1967665 RepID=A0A222G5Q7_9GAMM|nr:transposase [Cognaticolwellia beringensis]ASP47236.1 transposase [Cognaticolwellia beringensis]
MPKPRSQQISLSDTPYYHVCSRTVRKAFLCGIDKETGVSYEHRRSWIEQRIFQLSRVFSIDICAHAVMHNHLHLVLHVDSAQVKKWSTLDVLTRWHKLFKGTILTRKYQAEQSLTKFEMDMVEETALVYKQRLIDISWFMRALNEPIARQANKEDKCTGHFWEGRFKSQALLDEGALLACMAYVDLNPVRAGIAPTPEKSSFTSIQLRIKAALNGEQPKKLLPFTGNEKQAQTTGISFSLKDYLALVDETGRVIRADKHGAISANTANILLRLHISDESWLKLTTNFEGIFTGAVGTVEHLCEFTEHVGLKRAHGISNAEACLNSA